MNKIRICRFIKIPSIIFWRARSCGREPGIVVQFLSKPVQILSTSLGMPRAGCPFLSILDKQKSRAVRHVLLQFYVIIRNVYI